MKYLVVLFLSAGGLLAGPADNPSDNVEFVCMKKHVASKTCYYNFKIDGAKYRYVDIGCRFKRTDEVVRMAREGEIALAREWRVTCAEDSDPGTAKNGTTKRKNSN
jgi:hypothetical protein